MEEATVVRFCRQPGEAFRKGDPLYELFHIGWVVRDCATAQRERHRARQPGAVGLRRRGSGQGHGDRTA
jgi:hypothetical protein